jgi:adhesin transport system membrane fusion protein
MAIQQDDELLLARAERLRGGHRRPHAALVTSTLVLATFVSWTLFFRIDEVAQARGEVIASSRVQVIQSVDGGVLTHLQVREGDRVAPGQVLARLDPTRLGAVVGEVDARVLALRAKLGRLRAEVTEAPQPAFIQGAAGRYAETTAVELALFHQRRHGLQDDLRVMQVALDLARKELGLVEALNREGDASGTELLRAQRGLNDAESKLISRRNKFLEDARAELSKAEDELAQNDQVLTRRRQEYQDTVFVAQVAGIVKNIRITTVGGVLRAGDELMQIVPAGDELVIEAKVRPSDIARIRPGLAVSVRLDPFDYTVYGSLQGRVVYVSADTLKEDGRNGQETYYRVHVAPLARPVLSSTGRPLDMVPGMTAQVDVRTGDRTLMNYLLKPLRKTLAESFGER